jgi:hypothetical protein
MPGPGGFRGQQFLTEEEKANAPKVTPELLGRILGYLRPYWPQFLAVFVAILVGSFAAAILGALFVQVYHLVTNRPAAEEDEE